MILLVSGRAACGKSTFIQHASILKDSFLVVPKLSSRKCRGKLETTFLDTIPLGNVTEFKKKKLAFVNCDKFGNFIGVDKKMIEKNLHKNMIINCNTGLARQIRDSFEMQTRVVHLFIDASIEDCRNRIEKTESSQESKQNRLLKMINSGSAKEMNYCTHILKNTGSLQDFMNESELFLSLFDNENN